MLLKITPKSRINPNAKRIAISPNKLYIYSMSILDSVFTAIFGSKKERDLKELLPIVEKINEKESWAKSLSAEDFPKQTALF